MPWNDAVLNADADAAAATRLTLTMHEGDPGTSGAGEVADAALSWEAAGDEGPEASIQPATVGVAYAAPSVDLPADSSITHYGFRNGSTFLGGFRLSSPIETTAAETRTIPVRIGPKA